MSSEESSCGHVWTSSVPGKKTIALPEKKKKKKGLFYFLCTTNKRKRNIYKAVVLIINYPITCTSTNLIPRARK